MNNDCTHCGTAIDREDYPVGDYCSENCELYAAQTDDDDALCGSCNGSGEGYHEGSHCVACNGSGEWRVAA